MKYCYRLIFILLPFLMLGCPLTSIYPLGDSRSAPMDEKYIGKWAVTELGLSSKEVMWVFPFNENEYYIETRVITEDKIFRFRAFLTVIDNVNILNAQEIDEKKYKREYSFIKISLSADNILSLWVIDDNLLPNKSPSREDLLQYVRSNISNEKIYNKLTSFKRQVE